MHYTLSIKVEVVDVEMIYFNKKSKINLVKFEVECKTGDYEVIVEFAADSLSSPRNNFIYHIHISLEL